MTGETERVIRLVADDPVAFAEILVHTLALVATDLAESEPGWADVDTRAVDWRAVLAAIDPVHPRPQRQPPRSRTGPPATLNLRPA